LIAQDRVLVRRVRALLEREPLCLHDETGWKLSTTRAAAQVMSMLRASRADATTDALLDWLKSGSACIGANAAAALSSLEAACRRHSLTSVAALARAALSHADLAPEAGRLWASASAVLAMLSAGRHRPLAQWLRDLPRALSAAGEWDALQADDAGRQVIAALRLGQGDWLASPAWVNGASQVSMDHDEFAAWTDTVLEQATFVPSAGHGEPAHVVVTPLARAMLRPFAAVVFPGADDRRLGAAPASNTLLNDRQALALQVPTSAQRRETELLGFAQLLATPQVTFMRRRVDGADPVADSPLIERLSLALGAQGRTLARWSDPRATLELSRTPVHMSAPVAAELLPKRLSASACEALRACPYRFFALHMLRLRERDELEREVGKRDYGTWLHAVLFEFHAGRTAPAPGAVDVARLMSLAAEQQARLGIGDADFLPFAASFAHLAPRYVDWLQQRDRDGARWLRGEDDVSTRPDAMGDIELRGIVDRVDEVSQGAAIQVIDYKTGAAAALKERVRQPFEDTQLAFYAALIGSTTALPLRAMYLALDGGKHLEEVMHKDVETSAAALVDGLANDLRRLRDGAGLPALGEGSTCDHCEARGVCRRDHWSDGAASESSP
ncbi:MAG: PD-(D/E)XK nuclease family protein, partial [Burkholderiaceae bacterium]